MLVILSKLFPWRIRKRYKDLIKYSYMETSFENFVGSSVLLGMLVGSLLPAILFIFFHVSFTTMILTSLFLFFLVVISMYALLVLRADSNSKFIENILPDALMLMSMNIKSGMTTDRALIMAARPEFGPLERELNRTGKNIMAGQEISRALLDMTTRVKSRLFDRTIRLIIEGIESGGEMSSLLKQTAEDIQTTRLVQNEIRSNVMMYAIFIFFAAGVGSPLLFGISTYLIGSISSQFSLFEVTELSEQTVSLSLQVSPNFLVLFAVIALAVTSFFAGLMIGIIRGGTEKAGIKLIPVLLALSLVVFFTVRTGVASIFPVVV